MSLSLTNVIMIKEGEYVIKKNMIKTNMLKSKMTLFGDTQQILADVLDITHHKNVLVKGILKNNLIFL